MHRELRKDTPEERPAQHLVTGLPALIVHAVAMAAAMAAHI